MASPSSNRFQARSISGLGGPRYSDGWSKVPLKRTVSYSGLISRNAGALK